MSIFEAPTAFGEAPTGFGKAPRLLVYYGADVERLGRALQEVRGKRVAKRPVSEPELAARVKEVLLQLGYPVPDPPDE